MQANTDPAGALSDDRRMDVASKKKTEAQPSQAPLGVTTSMATETSSIDFPSKDITEQAIQAEEARPIATQVLRQRSPGSRQSLSHYSTEEDANGRPQRRAKRTSAPSIAPTLPSTVGTKTGVKKSAIRASMPMSLFG